MPNGLGIPIPLWHILSSQVIPASYIHRIPAGREPPLLKNVSVFDQNKDAD